MGRGSAPQGDSGPGWAALPAVALPSGTRGLLLGCSCWRVSHGKRGTASRDMCHFCSWPISQSEATWSQDLCPSSRSPPGSICLPRRVTGGQLGRSGLGGDLGIVNSGAFRPFFLSPPVSAVLCNEASLSPCASGVPGGRERSFLLEAEGPSASFLKMPLWGVC